MYGFLKQNIKKIIPTEFLIKHELIFRYLHGVLYLGNYHECNICGKKLKSFIKIKNDDLLCPFCGSLSRNRRLWQLLNEESILKGTVLHFSPSRSLYRNLKKDKNIIYFSTDLENEFLADYKFDITNIDQPNEKFDLIICYHVLEHIIDDRKAISELKRVLKKSGSLFIQTPFKEGEILEDFSVTTPEERKRVFGQKDHVRIYSITGLKKRLEETGLIVKKTRFEKDQKDLKFGFKSPEYILISTK